MRKKNVTVPLVCLLLISTLIVMSEEVVSPGTIFVDAGPDQIVNEGTPVHFGGSASSSNGTVQLGPELLVNDDPKVGGGKFQSHPAVAVGLDGIAHIVWSDARNTNMWEIFYANSIDGLTINPNVEVTDYDPVAGCQGAADVAVDNLGRIHVAWNDMRDWPNASAIYYSRSDDGGLTFSQNMRVDEWLGRGVGYPTIAFGPFNDLYIGFENSGSSIYYSKSTDGGDSFGPTNFVTDNGDHPQMLVDANSLIHMVWRAQENRGGVSRSIVVYSKSSDGFNFSNPVRVNNGTETNSEHVGGIDIDPFGNIHVLYNAALEFPVGGVRSGVYHTVSKDGGISFSRRVRVSDEDGPSVPQGRFALDPFGNPHVAWKDQRAGTSEMDVYYDYSTDGGLSFGQDTRVATVLAGAQYDADIAVDYQGFPHIVWGDGRINGDIDVYYRGGFIENRILSFEWDFDDLIDNDNDGIYDNDKDALGRLATHTYGDNGVFNATLTVLTEDGESSKDTCSVTVINTSPSIIPPSDSVAPQGTPIVLTADATDSGSDDLTFIWNWSDETSDNITKYYNDNSNPDPHPSPDGVYPFSISNSVTHTYEESGTYDVKLTVIDDDGGYSVEYISVKIESAPSVLPPILYIRISEDGQDAIPYWDPPPISGIDHYLIYRSTSQARFDFNSVWVDTSRDINLATGTIDPLTTMWIDTNATNIDHQDYRSQYFYLIRAVNTVGEISTTSNTVGYYRMQFYPGLNTFSLPLKPFNFPTLDEYVANIIEAISISWLDVNEDWDTYPNNPFPPQAKMGEGYVLDLSDPSNFVFTGEPASMIVYQEGFGFDDVTRDDVTAFVNQSGDVTVSWTPIVGADKYEVLKSTTRNGFHTDDYVSFDITATQFIDFGTASSEGQIYYMVVPYNDTLGDGSSTYSIGVITEEYNGNEMFGLPLKPVWGDMSADWYVDQIPNALGIVYLKDGIWKAHFKEFPEGVYDTILEVGKGYEVSVFAKSLYTYIGW
jgi:PKD repeat protein